MFQTFTAATRPDDGPPRLAALRRELVRNGLDGFLIPRADRHQGEYVADCDARLAWLTGFTGSAGFCAALRDRAGVFIDGRYRVQVKAQVSPDVFTPVPWPDTKLAGWLQDALPHGGIIGFDAWLHTADEIKNLRTGLEHTKITLIATDNLVDRIWADRPAPPQGKITAYPVAFAGKTSALKRADCAARLTKAGQRAAVLTLPDSIAWLLNIRGTDLPSLPVAQAFALLHDDARVTLFTDRAKLADLPLDPQIEVLDWSAFDAALLALSGPVRVDRKTAPYAVSTLLADAGIKLHNADDPCILPKACKTEAEIAATTVAHLRDGAAMVEFLCWLDENAPSGSLTEIDVVRALEGFRRATNALQDISFDTICGTGPHGAIVHYRVTEDTNRQIATGDLLLVDSGGQYIDGTTDITRTVPIGPPSDDHRACFTRVLQGMIAISRARWPLGLAGRDLDALARMPLWQAGQDYDHGTGHGVGVFLSVHEGPQRISRVSDTPLEAGMILSNEPGYYREGAFGIRIENLIVVHPAPDLPQGDARKMLSFVTLTHVPIDRRLIDAMVLTAAEREWLNAYHAATFEKISPRVSASARVWLAAATAPI